MSNPNVQTLAQARDAWKTRLRAAYFESNGGFVTVALILASFIALASSGDLTDSTMLAACAGWVLAMPMITAAPALFAAGPYPSAAHHADGQPLAPVMVSIREQGDVDPAEHD